MERQLATVQMILDIQPIANADKLEVATVRGWHVVVSKEDRFKKGDKVVYIEIDSVCPAKEPFMFLEKRKFRVKTIKLRGQVSQGLIMPMNILNKDYPVGTDVTEKLGITKFDQEAMAESNDVPTTRHKYPKWLMRWSWFRNLFVRNTTVKFPDWIPKTDETRIQNLTNEFEQWKADGVVFTGTYKVDGCSSTFYIDSKNRFGVCSRNKLVLPDSINKQYWYVAKKYDLEKKFKAFKKEWHVDHMYIQGEIIGAKIQGDKYKVGSDYQLKVYNLVIDNIIYNYKEIKEVCGNMGLPIVDIAYEPFKIEHDWTTDTMVEMAKGKSFLNPSIQREGVVFRSHDYSVSFKAINPDFLIKFDE